MNFSAEWYGLWEKSTILTTDLSFKTWGRDISNPKIANSILDKVLHPTSVVNIVGNSYQLKNYIQIDDRAGLTK